MVCCLWSTACATLPPAFFRRRFPWQFVIGMELGPMSSEVVRYRVDEDTIAQFEIEPLPGFRPAGTGDIAGTIKASVGPAVEAAKVILDQLKQIAPDSVEVKFGVKVTGTANWLVAKAATEGNFEVTLSWRPGDTQGDSASGD
jgi:Trypsin-co-occurring domain 1